MNFNKVILAGNLTRDPVLGYTPNETAYADFGLAVNRKWKSKDGNSKDEPCFVDCTAWGRQAENISKYFRKGTPILVEGRLTFASWTVTDGAKRNKLFVTVESFQFVPRGERAESQ